MIEKPTTFILGAGASVGYRFPTGSELVKLIADWRKSCRDDFFRSDLRMDEFSKAVLGNQMETIDGFLEQHDDFTAEGKYAITTLLASRAGFDYSSGTFPDPWYSFFWNRLLKEHGAGKINDPLEIIDGNKIRIITFNYDTSFEDFLWHRFNQLFPKLEKKQIINALVRLSIVHVHGRINYYPWETGTIPPLINIVGPLTHANPDAALEMSKKIVLVHEPEAKINFETARESIENSQNVIFIGFGFHHFNTQRLAGEAKQIRVATSGKYFNPETNSIHSATEPKIHYSFTGKHLSATGVKMSGSVQTRIKRPEFGLRNIHIHTGETTTEILTNHFDEMVGLVQK